MQMIIKNVSMLHFLLSALITSIVAAEEQIDQSLNMFERGKNH